MEVKQLVENATKIVVVQADNPDADSLCSALALEQMLEEQGKHVYLYCGIMIPEYLRYISGWDRVLDTPPSDFDLSIFVDVSSMSLLGKLQSTEQFAVFQKQPCVVLDHHAETDNSLHFANVVMNKPELSSTGELLFELAKEVGWPIDVTAGEHMMTAILGDTQGLTNELTAAGTYMAMAELTKLGVSRPKLEELRRASNKMHEKIYRYKAELILRTELHADNQIALVTIPQDEINTFSPLYNPAPLIQNDMLQTADVRLAVVIKHYSDGHILCSLRSAYNAPVAADLAAHFGGGGHPHAAGFKLEDGRPLNEVKSECIRYATELLQQHSKGLTDETIQHTF